MSNTNRKKVLFLITKSNWGGAQRYVHDLAVNLDPKKFDVVVAMGGDGELKEKLAATGIKTITIQALQRDISVSKEIRFAMELLKIIHQEKPDVLHVNSSKAGGVGCFIGRLLFVHRVIFTAHGWAFNEDRSRWQRLVLKFFHWLTVFLSHQTIAVSVETKNQLNWPLLKNRWQVIHNGRQPIAFFRREDARKALHLPADATLSGTIGELHPIKLHHVMIEAVAELRAQGHELIHVIIGSGQTENELRALANKRGVHEQIIFLGAVHEAARYLKAFDIYVQPSRSEALAYTIIEAAQAGLPIVASRVGGIPEIIVDQKSGLLVPSNQVDALAQAITKLINDPAQRVALAQAAKLRSEQFTFSTMLEKTVAVYDSSTTSSASAESRAID